MDNQGDVERAIEKASDDEVDANSSSSDSDSSSESSFAVAKNIEGNEEEPHPKRKAKAKAKSAAALAPAPKRARKSLGERTKFKRKTARKHHVSQLHLPAMKKRWLFSLR